MDNLVEITSDNFFTIKNAKTKQICLILAFFTSKYFAINSVV